MVIAHEPPYILLLSFLCLACFLVLVYFIFRQKEKRRPILRTLLSFVALLSLLALMLEPQINSPRGRKVAILLTENSSPNQLNQLLDSLTGGESVIFSLDQTWDKVTLRKITPIVTAAHISSKFPEIGTVYVLGDGLDKANATLLVDKEIIPLLNIQAQGIIHITHPATLHVGELLTIQGDFHVKDTATLYLSDLNGRLDSVEIGENSAQFELSTLPKISGKQSFILNSPGLTSDTIYVHVAPFVPLEIVALVSSPGFEFNALKNWLADKHHQLAVRTRVSKDKFNYEYLNWTKEEKKIDIKLLENTDLLLADSRSLKDLSGVEISSLQRSVAKGLKVIVMSDESLKPGEKVISGLMDVSLHSGKEPERKVSPEWLGKVTEDLSLTAEGLIPTGNNFITIMKDQQNDPLVVQQIYAEGALALVMLKDSYSLLLNGLNNEYDELWSYIIRRIKPENKTRVSFYISPDLPTFTGEPVSIIQYSSNPTPAYIHTSDDTDTLYFSQNKLKDGTFNTDFWPQHQGWHEIVSSEDSMVRRFLYVYNPQQFPALRQKEMAYNTRHIAKKSKDAASSVAAVPVNPLIFFIVFLLSAGGLWLEKKIGD